jgi:uncharacterized membrane protein YedE/YeeE
MPSWLLHEYWPFWLGAAFFGAFVVSLWMLERRLLGVSGSYGAAIELTREEDDAARRLDAADPKAIDDAMMRATLAAFGEEEVAKYAGQTGGEAVAPRSILPRSVHVTFLVMLGVGGLLGALAQGSWQLRFDLGPVHEALFGGPASIVVLLVGGVLVGLGTRMAGGCTSGHGLSGCSRLVPASLASTAAFFGTGVAVSFLLDAVMR